MNCQVTSWVSVGSSVTARLNGDEGRTREDLKVHQFLNNYVHLELLSEPVLCTFQSRFL